MDIFTAILTAMWDILRDAAPFMIFGFAIAGLMRAFVPADLVARHLGRGGARSVIKAAVLGAPPAAVQLQRAPGRCRTQRTGRKQRSGRLLSHRHAGNRSGQHRGQLRAA